MHRIDHTLLSDSIGSRHVLSSFHFGKPASGPKVYIQASLHAEELPGMLTAYHLTSLLEAAEQAGEFLGEVVLVPMANPIGLAQRVDYKMMGRFELGSSENFNRHYPDLAQALWPIVQNQLGNDANLNRQTIRQAARQYLANIPIRTQLESLRITLLRLAVDADVVIDLHCDCEAVLHVYAENDCWPTLAPLAALLRAQTVLLAQGSGGLCFDECLSGLWWQLAQKARAQGLQVAIDQGCASTTVELRGEADVAHDLAASDAQAILAYLRVLGVLENKPSQPVQLPAPMCVPTPLAGSQMVTAPVAGVLVFHANVGQSLAVGDVVAELIHPIDRTATLLKAEVTGVMYARTRDRYAKANDCVANIAGAVAFRTGPLLGF